MKEATITTFRCACLSEKPFKFISINNDYNIENRVFKFKNESLYEKIDGQWEYLKIVATFWLSNCMKKVKIL